jgi:glycosyltransferase involved in cell wall biosynthesis
MVSHRIYYSLKPYLPWRVRIGVRRMFARRLRREHHSTWPINEAAARVPEGWPGWPDGKKFAFVLTHDVEGTTGLAKTKQLAELERELGYRSTFNFIPEGPYRVPAELRLWLRSNGFEFGVHDLRHDGWLFKSRATFEERAKRINTYIRDWDVRGFRSGFMLRNLDWLQLLDVQYDASTFDTDPFEMQSDGAGTIFPYWVPSDSAAEKIGGTCAGRRGGYLELPYTLPQDSTLFLLLQERSPEIWLRKLDWVAQQGGMALVNVHPDYVQFEGDDPQPRTFPVSYYLELLNYARRRYGDIFWQPVAGELADYARRFKPRQPPPKKRVCMITHSFYENDNRVMRYATALAARGDHVDVLALRRSEALPVQENVDGVNIHRIVERSGKQERAKLEYLWSWMRFLLTAARWTARHHRQEAYQLFHVHNMPDFLVFAAWYPKRRGARVILDIHDITPEFYTSKFGAAKRNLAARILEWTERRSARVADHIIISNHLWLEKYAERTRTRDRCSVFINNVDSSVFRPHPRTRNDARKLIIFPGGLQWHQGLDIALRAFAQVSQQVPEAEFHIYGDGNQKPALLTLAKELGLNGQVRFFDPVGVRDVAQIMADADVGVVPKRADSFGNEAYSTKIMEFMSVGVPVVISSTKIDRYYFSDSVARFFPSGDVDQLAAALVEVLTDEGIRTKLIENATAYVAEHSWAKRQGDYLQIVDSLTNRGYAECKANGPAVNTAASVLAV